MSAIEISNGVSADRWDHYVERHPEGNGYHLFGWRDVFSRAFGHSSEYLAALRGGQVAGVLPLTIFESRVFGRFAVSVPFVNYGGVLGDSEEVERALVEAAATLAASRKLAHVELRHLRRHFPDLPAKEHKVTMLLPLASSADGMWGQLDRKVRNQVRKAEKSELTCVAGGAELLDEFYPVFATNMRDLGTPVYGRVFFEEVFRAFPQRTKIFSVRRGAQPICAGITWRSRDTLEMPWASSLREFRSLSPNNLLYWEVIKSAIADGCRVFDFGRSTPNEGTYQFKEQWGAVPHLLSWEYRMIGAAALPDHSPKNPKFSLAIAAWKKLPVPVASWLGPSIVRSIP
jgi:FemAB-related protein (PEP-CTERM system-associated)